MEDDPQDLGGEGNHEHGDKAIVIKNTQKPGPRNQAMREHFKYPGTCASYFYGTNAHFQEQRPI